MSKNNIIDTVAQGYAKYGPNPLGTALLLGAGVWGLGKVAWGPIVETLRSIGRPVGRAMLGGSSNPNADQDWNTAMDNLKLDSSLSRWVPRIFGGLAAASVIGLADNPDQEYRGWLKWNAPLAKSAFFNDFMNMSQTTSLNPYVVDLDWNRPIQASAVSDLFKQDPHLQDEPYARNMGLSIVQNAAMMNHTKQPTLGNIFDSAVDKIENKLTFGGLANVALKTAVANGISRLFTGAIGTMCDLSPQSQQALVDAGTWAGAITSMLQ